MTQLYQINVKLSENQKKNIADAYKKRETVVIRLTNDSLSGKDTLNVPATVKKRLEKNRKEKKRYGDQALKNQYQETDWW